MANRWVDLSATDIVEVVTKEATAIAPDWRVVTRTAVVKAQHQPTVFSGSTRSKVSLWPLVRLARYMRPTIALRDMSFIATLCLSPLRKIS
jgi:hypothetical protein